jgi:hypothetical protein
MSKLGIFNNMEIKEDNSGHVPKLVHQFYFVKLWPTNPDSICKIKKEENIIMKMNQDTSKFSDIIAKKTVYILYNTITSI